MYLATTTQKENSLSPRYSLIRKTAWELLCEAGVTLLPIDPYSLIQIHKWDLISVGELAKKTGFSREETISSLDGEVKYCPKNCRYCIIYDEKAYEDRIPYSLGHEIGHITLGHVLELEQAKKNGYELTNEQYDFFEFEADIFSSELLMPTPILLEIDLIKPTIIKRYCGVSKQAANTKANFLKSYIAYKNDLEITAKIKRQFRHFINLYQKQYHLINEEHYSVEENEAAATRDDPEGRF